MKPNSTKPHQTHLTEPDAVASASIKLHAHD
jgi:hypothetical protein